jgi:hypothetical protein
MDGLWFLLGLVGLAYLVAPIVSWRSPTGRVFVTSIGG